MAKGKLAKLEKAMVRDNKPAPPKRRPPGTTQEVLAYVLLFRRFLKKSKARSLKRRTALLKELEGSFEKRVRHVQAFGELLRALRRVGSAAVPPVKRRLDEFSDFLGKPKSTKPWEPFYKDDKFARTRRTGGIREQRAMVMDDDSIRFEVGGELQDSISPIRTKFDHPDGTHRPMDYSSESGSLRAAKSLRYDGMHLVDEAGDAYERAHLWGHGFGDEARAGIMYAPKEVNQTLQRLGIEGFLTDQAGKGGRVTVIAAARSHPPLKPFSSLKEERGEFLLRHLTYEFKVKRADGSEFVATLEFEIPKPPGKPVEIGGSLATPLD